MDKALLRNIPKVDELLAPVRALCPNASAAAVTAAVRRTMQKLRELGFLYVSCDLAGFRSGSMNEALGAPDAKAPRA